MTMSTDRVVSRRASCIAPGHSSLAMLLALAVLPVSAVVLPPPSDPAG